MNEREAIVALIDSRINATKDERANEPLGGSGRIFLTGQIAMLESIKFAIERGDHLKGNSDDR